MTEKERCSECDEPECPCPGEEGCHGGGGFDVDRFDPESGHYTVWRLCEKCEKEAKDAEGDRKCAEEMEEK